MFPNQQGRDSWGSVSGYYGNYGGMAGGGTASSWYNRSAAGQPSWMGGAAAWGGAGYPTTASSGLSGEESAMMASLSNMSNMEREAAADMISFPQNSSRQKLGINSNIYSLYQSKHQSRESLSSGYMSSRSPGPGHHSEHGHTPGHTDTSPYHGHYTDQTQQCLQEQQHIEKTDSSGPQEEPSSTMEPDSSTDGHEAAVNKEEDTADNSNNSDDKMQRLFAEHAKMFGVKSEPGSSEGRKFKYKTAQEELAQLMKLTNEKLFKTTKRTGLTVDIDETETSSDSVSPPRNPFIITNSLSPRRRGRKPKHYSEILYELGQRGISITKTKQQQQQHAGHLGSGSAGGQHSSSREMVVSETGAVSHKASGQQLKCPHCNKILTTSVGLMYHIRLHTGEKPYTCEICSKSFATSSHYHYHIRSHSGEKPYRNFRCDFCGKMYTASGSLRLHLKSHLSRLAANAFGSINNMSGINGSIANMSEPEDPLHVGQNDFKFGIKQEISEHYSEDPENRHNTAETPKSNDRSSCDGNILVQDPKQESS